MFGDVFELVLQVVESAGHLPRIRPVPGGEPRELVGHVQRRLGLPRREHQPPARPRVAIGFARDLERGVGVVERVQGGGEIGAHARVTAERGRGAEQRHLAPPAGLRRRRRTAGLHHQIITHGSQGSASDAAGILVWMNRLAQEPSLYLRQHADNPVDWYPWGTEALARAAAEDKPLLISIGYSSCHWCHVMAHESFEDPAVAAVMNEHFVCIKVDREERPDLDALYMQATLLLARQGGWPMTVFATPDGRPYFAGTYFPPTSRGSMPGFAELCAWMAAVYRERGADVEAQAAELVGHMERIAARRGAETGDLGRHRRDAPSRSWRPASTTPKAASAGRRSSRPRPCSSSCSAWTVSRRSPAPRRRWRRSPCAAWPTAESATRSAAAFTATRPMTSGWSRTSRRCSTTMRSWRGSTCARRVARHDPRWREVAEQTLDFLVREMELPGGGFAAAQDADSPGGEGAFFVWTPEEIDALLPPDQARAVKRRFGVTAQGNFEGRTILHAALPLPMLAEELGVGPRAAAASPPPRPSMQPARGGPHPRATTS